MSLAYWGSKRRFANEIADVLCGHAGAPMYYEPFCGMASVGLELVRRGCFTRMLWSDSSEDVVVYWQALQRGWLPQTHPLTQTQWDGLKRTRSASPRRSFYGFHMGYGGQLLLGRSPTADMNRSAPLQRVRERLKEAAALLRTSRVALTVERLPCEALRPHKHSVIYCDPPYAVRGGGRTTSDPKHSSAGAMGKIWECIERWVLRHACVVYLSAAREAPEPPASLRLVRVKEWTILNRMQTSKLGAAQYRKELLFRVEAAPRRHASPRRAAAPR